MLSHAGLGNVYWAEAVATATFLRNHMVSTALKIGETPYLLWYGEKPNLKHVRVFGCMVYTHIPDRNCKKLDKKAQKLRFIDYIGTPSNSKFGMMKSVSVISVMISSSMKMTLGRAQMLLN